MDLYYLVEFALYIPLLPAAVAIWKWRDLNKSQRWFAVLIWTIVVISLSGELYQTLTVESNNMPFFHTYILLEYLILIQVFRWMFMESISIKTWRALSVGFIIIWLFNVISGEGWWGFPDYIHALEAIILLALVIKWFLKMLREKKITQPQKTFEFWICAGLLLFFSGNFLMFLFPKFLIDTGKEVFEAIWPINCVLIILLYLIYTVALLWIKKTNK